MAGVKGRSGRYKPYQTVDVNRVAELSLRSYIRAFEDPSIPNLEKARLALPIVSKRFPDKVEVTAMTVSLSNDVVARLIEIYQGNSFIDNNLDTKRQAMKQLASSESVPPQDIVVQPEPNND